MRYVIILFFSLLIATTALAQSTFNVGGVITTDDGYAGFATVAIEDLQIAALADENGRFTLRRVPVGTHKILFRRMGLVDKVL
ncbi:MAG: hypothetical protein IKP62_03745, partial [Salinivirgaceae bacterium]|nr:hypothetical protein [Salinivirgaceae bacterium]